MVAVARILEQPDMCARVHEVTAVTTAFVSNFYYSTMRIVIIILRMILDENAHIREKV